MNTLFPVLTSCLLVSAVVASADNSFYSTEGNSVTVRVKQPASQSARLVRLQVVCPDIIRVEATAETAFPAKQSLVIVPQQAFTAYSVSESGGTVEVKTAHVRARVDGTTGRVTFLDADGHTLLSEACQGGKTFTPYIVPAADTGVGKLTDTQRKAWSWRMLFDSPADEAFYGLGQHQAEELNMKGKNEELFQYNTKISVPFVVSNKGYGLLWDSYSLCRWGNPDDYLQLQRAFTLYDKDGQPGALTGTYTDKQGRVVQRREDSLYFENSRVIGNLPKNFRLNGSKVVYEGYIEPAQSSLYRFILYYAGYMKVYIGGKEVVAERWRTAWNPNSYKFATPIRQGERTPIRIEWKPDVATEDIEHFLTGTLRPPLG